MDNSFRANGDLWRHGGRAAVEQLDMLILAFDAANQEISESPWPELNAKSFIAGLIEIWNASGIVATEGMPKDVSRFADNIYAALRSCTRHHSQIDDILRQFADSMQSNPPKPFPRGISLWQWFIAELVDRSLINPRDSENVWHITDEVLSLYPGTVASGR